VKQATKGFGGENHVQYYVCRTMRAWSSFKWYSVIQFNETKASRFDQIQNCKSERSRLLLTDCISQYLSKMRQEIQEVQEYYSAAQIQEVKEYYSAA
jgi:hypothetical protein